MTRQLESAPEAAHRAGIPPLDYLTSRGFAQQLTDRDGLATALEQGSVPFYVGFDPTAASMHVGNLLPIMLMATMQQFGHRPIVLLGGATALIGDPSGKSTSRPMLSSELIERNRQAIQAQFARFLAFEPDRGTPAACVVNNADWLKSVGLIDFLRDIGRHFSINAMLATEAYRTRMERGLSFLELAYQTLQAFDFWHLYRTEGCQLQAGGSDQWTNILAGIDLTRRLEGTTVYGLVSPLITTSTGGKMGKTEQGAVWLDPEQTSPFDYFQFWRNTTDADVKRFLNLYTFLPTEQITELTSVTGAALREAKSVLAFEATALAHGHAAAEAAAATAQAFFARGHEPTWLDVSASRETATNVVWREGLTLGDLFVQAGLCRSRNDARRLVIQGGLRLDGQPVADIETPVDPERESLFLQVGKKRMRLLHLTLPATSDN